MKRAPEFSVDNDVCVCGSSRWRHNDHNFDTPDGMFCAGFVLSRSAEDAAPRLADVVAEYEGLIAAAVRRGDRGLADRYQAEVNVLLGHPKGGNEK